MAYKAADSFPSCFEYRGIKIFPHFQLTLMYTKQKIIINGFLFLFFNKNVLH